jgi:putative membrane protein
MRNWIVSWIASVLALAVVVYAVVGKIDNPAILFLTVVALGLVNSFIRPIIMFFAWPVNCLTFGLFGFVLNVLMFWVVVGYLIPDFGAKGPLYALIGSVAMGILSGVFHFALKEKGDKR